MDTDSIQINDQSDNYWLTTRTPAVTYGLRGIMYYRVTVKGPLKDLHSGVYGGMVYEPLAILTKLLASLTSSDGAILVPGVNELVEPLTSVEEFVTNFLTNSAITFNITLFQ